MHQNFYHWHTNAELTPDTSILEPRWNAAAKVVAKSPVGDLVELLRLALFPPKRSDFSERFTSALVKAEPTFPAVQNENLLRVMAAASLSSKLENYSTDANVIALGVRCSNFPEGRVTPISNDLLLQSDLYLSHAAEYYRPQIAMDTLLSTEKKLEANVVAMKEAVAAGEPPKVAAAVESFGRLVIASVKESHAHIARVATRLSEENQAAWWLLSARSSLLNKPRSSLGKLEYALVAAVELSKRVNAPPPASAEHLLEAVLSQCSNTGESEVGIADIPAGISPEILGLIASEPKARELMPITFALWEQKSRGKVSAAILKEIGVVTKKKFDSPVVAKQFFRELMFSKAFNH